MGGGTPSLLNPEIIAELLASLPLLPAVEITLESNPGTVDKNRLQAFRAAGVNRLSLGIQSFNDCALRRLGRIHDRRQAMQAVEDAAIAGFTNLNLDLMFGLPEQTLAEALLDLQTAQHFNLAHLSWYQLTIEPETAFYRQPPLLPDDDLLWEMQEQGQQYLAERGYSQYEISAYSKPDSVCQHNLNYWRFGDYLGIGAGAHGKISNDQRVLRTAKLSAPRAYLQAFARPETYVSASVKSLLTPAELALEFMLNALRLTEGFAPSLFTDRTGLPLTSIETPLRLAQQRGWLTWTPEQIAATPLGLRFLNNLLELFIK